MASVNDQFLQEIESLFGSIGPGGFSRSMKADAVPYEGVPGNGQINPVGWVQNAQTDTGVATVVIDADGITITEGALTFVDAFGETVLTGAGFGATWVDFINSMVYNHSFRAGTTTNITAITEVSGGDTDADYAASISADLPYWVVSIESGAGTFKRVADSTAVSGFALEWNGNENAEIYQDIPISPGQVYSTYLTWKYTNSASDFFSVIGCQFRDASHGAIGVVVEQSLLFSTSQSTYTSQGMNWSETAPGNARYLRVFIAMTRNSGSPVVKIAAVNVDPINVYGPQRVIDGTTVYDNARGIGWTNGTTTDIALVRSGANQVSFEVPLGGTSKVRSSTFNSNESEGQAFDAANNFMRFEAMAANPTAPAAGALKLYCITNGSGKEELRARFATGAVQTIATEP